MRFEMAPLEGITTYIYRNAHARHYGKMDKYYTPFLSLHKQKEFSQKELNELLPDHNDGLNVIPQVLTNSAEDFLRTSYQLKEIGYEEVNINMGCPSGTVTAKGKGAGMLADPDKLNAFLEAVFDKTPVEISIKTRLGTDSASEWDALLEVYRKYPLKELIVHARVRQDFYKNQPDHAAFGKALCKDGFEVCYNGDVFDLESFAKIQEQFPALGRVMLGRGLIARPWIACSLKMGQINGAEKERLRAFHDELYAGYQKVQSGEKNILFRMKEFWTYMIQPFAEAKRYGKKIRKASRCLEYEGVINELFRTSDYNID